MKKSKILNYGWLIATFAMGMFLASAFVNSSNEKVTEAEYWSPNGSDPCIAEITLFAGTYAPRGWAFCDGQLLPVSQNDALFSLLGTTYGGDGRTTFALPDLRGRVPIHAGSGPGLTTRRLGSKGGSETTSLPIIVNPGQAGPIGSTGNITGIQSVTKSPPNNEYYTWAPSLALNYIIALQGLYCSRD